MISRPGLYARLLRGGFWAFLGKAGAAFLGLLVTMLLARLAPAQDMGLYFQAVAIIGMASGVFQFGLPQATVRAIAANLTEEPSQARRLARASVALATAAGVAAALSLCGLLALFGGRFNPAWPEVGMALAGWLFGIVVTGILAESFRGLGRLRAAALFGGLLTMLLLLAMVSLAWWQGWPLDFAHIVNLLLVAAMANALLALLHAAASFGMGRLGRPGGVDYRALLAAGVTIGATNILLMLFSQADVLILGAFRGNEEVAMYGAAARLVALVNMLLAVINLAVSPLIAELGAQRRLGELERMLRRTATLAGIPALLMLVLFLWQGEFVLELAFGPAYRGAAMLMVILALGQVVNVLAGSCGTVLVMMGFSTLLLKITLVCGLGTLLTALLLAAPWGGAGVAVAIAAGLALQNLAMVLAVRRKTGIWTHCYLPGMLRVS